MTDVGLVGGDLGYDPHYYGDTIIGVFFCGEFVVEIAPLPTDLNHSLSQLSHGIQYAFCSEDNRQATQYVFCKDYLQDAVWSFITKQSMGTPENPAIYGFHYDLEKNPPIDLKKTRLLIELPNNGKPDQMINLLSFLQQAEVALKIKPFTQIHPTNIERTVLLVGSPLWMRSSVTLSLYALLIRVGCSFEKTEESWEGLLNKIITSEVPALVSGDITTTKMLNPILPTLKEGLEECFGSSMEENFKSIDHAHLHDCTGVRYYASKNPWLVEKFPNWKFHEEKAVMEKHEDYYEDDGENDE